MCLPLDFQYNNIEDVFSIVKKRPLFVNFSLHHYGKYILFLCSAPLVGIRFYRHVPNSPRDKHKMLHNPCCLHWRKEKKNFTNFKLYNLANGKE
jgi:hypothetical protein